MNRTTSLFLALGILVAHALAIHQVESGRLAPAYDEAFVAFRMARNLFRVGLDAWSATGASFDSYPSPLWILVCWIPERMYDDPSLFAQVVGLTCAIATSVVLSRFSRDRLAGVIAPLLLVLSGSFAAAALSGTEAALLALFVTAGFLAYERRRPVALAAFLVGAVATRAEGLLFVLGLLAMELVRRQIARAGTEKRITWSFVPALVVAAAIASVRATLDGPWLSPAIAGALTRDAARLELGLAYLSDFLLKSGSAFLVLFPLLALSRGRLPGTARRGLVLVGGWFAWIAWTGGSSLPMWLAMAPILPVLFLTIQEGMTAVMDSRKRGLAAVTWTAFVVALLASALVSKRPGNLGRFQIAEVHYAAMTPSPPVKEAWDLPLGRTGLAEYLERTERLRSIGSFLREESDPELTIATPWPGSISYMSRRTTVDLLGRTAPPTGATHATPWYGAPRKDLIAFLQREPDHVVLSSAFVGEAPRLRDVLREWLARFDAVGDDEQRLAELMDALEAYEIVTVPVEDRAGSSTYTEDSAFFLVRRRELGLEVQLEVETEPDGTFRVLARHQGYDQLANLEVRIVDRTGDEWTMRPTGEFVRQRAVAARWRLLLHESGARPMELVRGVLPPELDAAELVVTLRNPGLPDRVEVSRVGSELRVPL